MTPSPIEHQTPVALAVSVSEDRLTVTLSDGRSISVPISWYPRLAHGTPQERESFRFIGRGEGIHWPDLDEDISVDNLLNGERSGESHRSFSEWLAARGSSHSLE